MFTGGNVIICGSDGCFATVSKNESLCKSHLKGKIIYKYCKSETICAVQANFGYENNKPLRCKTHSIEDMIDVRNKKCKSSGCKKQPIFGIVDCPSSHCHEHKTDEMIDLSHQKCIHLGCINRACYEIWGIISPKYCIEHKSEDMFNVTQSKCGSIGCKIQPIYGLEGGKLKFCNIHRSDTMVDLRHKKCLYPDCIIRAQFGYENQPVQYCYEHKKFDMINICNKICLEIDCRIVPNFGYKNESPQYCVLHKKIDMIDLCNKKCSYEGCELYPSYCLLYGTIYIHCKEHSTLNEYNSRKCNPKCTVLGCNNVAKYINNEDKLLQPIRCLDHKLFIDIEITQKICTSCSEYIYIPSNRDLCAICGNYRIKIYFNKKEHVLKEYLESKNIQFIHNKTVNKNGSLYRPDFLLTSNFGKIVLECDEYQHKRGEYTYTQEFERMITIFNDIKINSIESEILFIRYNPDYYKGIQFKTLDRLEYLYQILIHFINLDKLDIKLGVTYIFYDGFDNNPLIEEIKTDTIDQINTNEINIINPDISTKSKSRKK